MRRVLGLAFVCAALLAACERPAPPAAEDRAACADPHRAPADRVTACDALMASTDLSAADRVEAQAHRGAAHQAAGDVTPALRDFEAVLRADGNNAEALEGRAAILLASGQLDAVEPLVDRLIATNAPLYDPIRALLRWLGLAD